MKHKQSSTSADVNGQRPKVLEHFIGQRGVVDRIRVALEASWNDGTPLPHMLFVGPSGVGKTQLAQIIAKEVGTALKEQLAQNLQWPSSLQGFLVEADDRDVLFIDEIHELIPQTQTTLYRALEEKKLFIGDIGCQHANGHLSETIPLSKFSLIAATTDQYALLSPLLDRFRLVCHFLKYSPDELQILLDQRCKMLGWSVKPAVLKAVAQRGRGVPRKALRLLEAVHRTARAEGDSVMTMEHFQRTCALEGLDHQGLDALEQRYLALLKEGKGAMRVSVLAARLGLPLATIQQIVERPLLEEGFIEKHESGRRVLTVKGRECAKPVD